MKTYITFKNLLLIGISSIILFLTALLFPSILIVGVIVGQIIFLIYFSATTGSKKGIDIGFFLTIFACSSIGSILQWFSCFFGSLDVCKNENLKLQIFLTFLLPISTSLILWVIFRFQKIIKNLKKE